MSDAPALSIRGLVKRYRGGFEALKGVDLTVSPGDFYALLGPNGAGKSSIISILTSLSVKTAGSVQVLGYDLDRDLSAAKQLMGVVPQELNFNIFETPLQIVSNQGAYYGVSRRESLSRAQELLELMGLWDKRDSPAQRLSGGMKRRLMVARALVHRPQLLLLDEPTAGVDIEVRAHMWEVLKALNASGLTIILTTHYLEEAESCCNRLAIISEGKIVSEDRMASVLKHLDQHTMILTPASPLSAVPEVSGVTLRLMDPETLEVDLNMGDSLSPVFAALAAQGVEIMAMRNKHNRLEQYLLSSIAKNKSGDAV